ARWVSDSLAKDVPIHFSAFHPDYTLTSAPRTPTGTLVKAYELAKAAGLEFVYLGNVPVGDRDDTFCPVCGSPVIRRDGFLVTRTDLKDGKCGKCGAALNIVV
ncbi:MAG: AmmeMemoRadiSam system radical SAM enzyme, partial [Thermoplasmata archaeon]